MEVCGDHVCVSARPGEPPPPRDVVLLGASNLAMGLPDVLSALCCQRPGPLRVFAARGHGRSYANRSRVLLRELPGILECGLWAAIADSRVGPRADALITDVGNDLVYGATPDALIGWIETCVNRLERLGARILITHLPVASLERLSRIRFELVRRAIFPAHPIRFERMLEMVRETDDRLGDLARRRGMPTAVMRAAWYGFDPVHIRVRRRRTAWSEILSPWRAESAESAESGQAHSDGAESGQARFAYDGTGQARFETGQARSQAAVVTSSASGRGPAFTDVRRAKPQRSWFAGRERSVVQPARRLADGSELWLY